MRDENIDTSDMKAEDERRTGKAKITTNVDHYANVCRSFIFEKEYNALLIVHSGTDGISISTKSSNNGFVRLETDEVKQLIAELEHAIGFSRQAQNDMADFWEAKNNAYGMIDRLRMKFK